jgi:hypothetical protein
MGIGDGPQPPIPNPQSPIPNPPIPMILYIKINYKNFSEKLIIKEIKK